MFEKDDLLKLLVEANGELGSIITGIVNGRFDDESSHYSLKNAYIAKVASFISQAQNSVHVKAPPK